MKFQVGGSERVEKREAHVDLNTFGEDYGECVEDFPMEYESQNPELELTLSVPHQSPPSNSTLIGPISVT